MGGTFSIHSGDVRNWSEILKGKFSKTRYKWKYNIEMALQIIASEILIAFVGLRIGY
jgi:hypothetical protein